MPSAAMTVHFFPKIICLTYVAVIVVLCQHNVEGQPNKVSPKLDFDDGEHKNNSIVPIAPGAVQGRADGGQSTASGNNDGGGMGDASTTTSSSGKSGPKIHGVRVTVDTGDTHNSKESKESVEVADVGKHRKRVGIHTDITFEITADGEADINATSSAQGGGKEDASVPIYKGRGGTTHKPPKPYDPKMHWNPNFSSERRSYEGAGRSGPAYYYPQYYPNNVPVYTGSGDSRGGGSVYRRGDGWNSYVPSTSLWTTERVHNEPYRPNAVTNHRAPNWKPCYCITSLVDNRRRRDSSRGFGVLRPTAVVEVVDGKLDNPFSRK